MYPKTVARAFVALYLTLGVVVFIQSLLTVVHSAGLGTSASPNPHLVALAGFEAVAALLFVFQPTLRWGGLGLLLVFAVAAAFHGLHGEFPGTLFVYAAATAFIMVHGPITPERGRTIANPIHDR